MRDAVDLTEFARHGKLDAYELTDEELARLLELWRWTAWTHRNTPSGPDHDILDEAHRLQRQLARQNNMEMEYNTALLLKQELEPLMHLRVLLDDAILIAPMAASAAADRAAAQDVAQR